MILITGASGKTGRAISQALKSRGAQVRALVRRPEQFQAALQAGASEAMLGDITKQHDLATALQGVETVYHICPNVHPEEISIGKALIQAAQEAGTRRVVYHSVLHPQVEAMPHHWKKMRVEEMLFESGLDFTILQPAAYMQNTLVQMDSIRKQGIYSTPYRVSARLSMVDLQDVAEVVAKVLTETSHRQAIYELSGGEALTQTEVAAAFARRLGKPVQAAEQVREDWEARARKSGMGEYARETLLKMFIYYDQYGLVGNSNVLEWLLSRQPTTFEEWLGRIYKDDQE